MAKTTNPFTPAFGQVPLHMAGRESVMGEICGAFESEGADPNLTSILVGARGTGKTALLSRLSSEAEACGWICVNVTCLPGMLENIHEQALKHSAHLVDRSRSGLHLSGISVGGVGLEWRAEEGGARPTWRTRMEDLLDALAEVGVGLFIGVDEVDPALGEMAELAATYQHFLRDGRRVALIMAGLPTHVLSLLTSRESSFLRRACQHRIGRVRDGDIEIAFESTVRDGGKAIDEDALEAAVCAIDGFPFMLQLLGYHCWIAAGEDLAIDGDAVRRGVRRANRELRERIYDTAYQEMSQGDRDFLIAMLEDEGQTALSDLRERLGKTPQQISYQKKRLIGQGVVRDVTRGVVAFDMPGIREYLQDAIGT